MNYKRIVVLAGGPSSEREVSLESGKEVLKALISLGYEAELLDLDNFFVEKIKEKKPDIVFIALHGKPGEDGTVQGILEVLEIPYTGSGVLASALAINKLFTKKIFISSNLPVLPFLCFSREEWKSSSEEVLEKAKTSLGTPLVVKPVSQGSSVGVSIVEEENLLPESIEIALKYDEMFILEKFVKGREIQVGVLGNEDPFPLPPIEIRSKKKFFDYEAKYTPGLAEEITPAPIDEKKTERAQKLALKAYKALGCEGFARVDMFLVGERFYLSEVNTIPGLTANSLLPKEARAAGIDFPQLVEKILDFAWEKFLKKGSYSLSGSQDNQATQAKS
jgi:D-alanine-D-alanine ligase